MNCKCKKPDKYYDNSIEGSLWVRCENCKGIVSHKGMCEVIPASGEGVCENKPKYKIGKGKNSCVACGLHARLYTRYLDSSEITALTENPKEVKE